MVIVDICGVVLGSPYLYDRDAVFYKKEHTYHLRKMRFNLLSGHIKVKIT